MGATCTQKILLSVRAIQWNFCTFFLKLCRMGATCTRNILLSVQAIQWKFCTFFLLCINKRNISRDIDAAMNKMKLYQCFALNFVCIICRCNQENGCGKCIIYCINRTQYTLYIRVYYNGIHPHPTGIKNVDRQ